MYVIFTNKCTKNILPRNFLQLWSSSPWQKNLFKSKISCFHFWKMNSEFLRIFLTSLERIIFYYSCDKELFKNTHYPLIAVETHYGFFFLPNDFEKSSHTRRRRRLAVFTVFRVNRCHVIRTQSNGIVRVRVLRIRAYHTRFIHSDHSVFVVSNR